ncbi:MAG: hypothetical protein AAGK14_11965 [Verrucomicrobiota bacterium]
MNKIAMLFVFGSFLIPVALHADAAAWPDGDVTYVIKVSEHEDELADEKRRQRSEIAAATGIDMTSRYGPVVLEKITVKRYKTIIDYELVYKGGETSRVIQHVNSDTVLDQNMWNKDVYVGRLGHISLPEMAFATPKSLEWITNRNMVREEERNGRLCRVHEDKVTVWRLPDGSSPGGDPRPVELTFTAWVDIETGQPVALDDSEKLYEIGPSQVFGGPYELPEAFRKPWRKLQARLQPNSHL